jgi:hypothetical protein
MTSENILPPIESALKERSGTLSGLTSKTNLKWLVVLALTLAAVIGAIIKYHGLLDGKASEIVPLAFAILLSALLAFLPAALCLVQNVSRRRQLAKLDGLGGSTVAQTTLFQTARIAVDSARLVVDLDYLPPIIIHVFITFVGFLAVLAGYGRADYFSLPSILLGGLHDRSDPAALTQYQLQTFCIVGTAFIGSYVYTLGRILDRINNNDLYPISLYYYVVRVIVACAAAAVLRHTIGVFSDVADTTLQPALGTNAAPLLLLVGFAIGFAPDLFIVAMVRKAFQAMKVWGSRDDPDNKARPTSLPLLMIDDLTREKIDRLNELGIDSAQTLARQNPFLLLPRLPYDLSLLIDWIAQAQLYVLVKESVLKTLRESYVRDIFDLHVRLRDKDARVGVCGELGLPLAAGKALLHQLETDPSYLRLREVKEAMAPRPPHSATS